MEDDGKLVVMNGGNKPDKPKGVLTLSEKAQGLIPAKRLNKRELARFKDRVMSEYAPEAILTTMEGLLDRSKRGDTFAIQLLAKIIGLLEEKPQVAVQVNTTVNTGRKGGRRVEDLIRAQDERHGGLLPAARPTVIDVQAE